MAKPQTVRFGRFFVRLSDGNSPAQFVAPCAFTSKSFSRSKSLGEVTVPDCDDPDAPAWTERDVQTMSATISGEGVLAKGDVPTWEDALNSVESVEVEIELEYPGGDSDIYTGRFHMESLEISGTLGERVTISATMQSDGEITYARST